MSVSSDDPRFTHIRSNLGHYAPFSLASAEALDRLAAETEEVLYGAGDVLVREGEPLDHVYLIESGGIDIESQAEEVISRRGPGDIVGAQGMLKDGCALMTARAVEDLVLLQISVGAFKAVMDETPAFAAWFDRSKPIVPQEDEEPHDDLAIVRVEELMMEGSVTLPRSASAADAAVAIRDTGTHSVLVVDDTGPVGIVTTTDLTTKILAEGLDGSVAVDQIMTPNPITIEADALGIDALGALSENHIRQIPVVRNREVVGILESARLLDRKVDTTSGMILEILNASGPEEMAPLTERIPTVLSQLVGSGAHPTRVGKRITDITDAVTRRLLVLAEEKLGAPPVPYLWLACGSQGRREQTGTSDQDNCLIIDDALKAADELYFEQLAKEVTDGLNACGYVYCPGEMMASNPQWRQRRSTWREYFTKWIETPDNMAQMLASVMFDLRPIAGEMSLYEDLQEEVLKKARKNSIFVAHMVSNSLKHEPPLSIFRGLALIRSGEHKNTLDLKHSGVVPVTDLARIYALQGGIAEVSTIKRLEAARDQDVISESGAHDLIDAYGLIAQTRLRHQAEQARNGMPVDNFVSPRNLSDLERNHLRDAFAVIKTMQSSLRHGRASLS